MSPSFADLGVPEFAVANLERRGITTPFPIQAATLADLLDGKDVCGKAPTGSGKTLAFGIPLVTDLGNSAPRHPRRLVLVPTRELASQVCDELRLLVEGMHNAPRIEAVYGGVSLPKQAKALGRGVDIVVACPGRLADLINQRLVHLDAVEMVVLDEADRMADMGFIREVKRLLDQCPADRQTVLFSATLDGEIDELVRRYQVDPAVHEVEERVDPDAGTATHHFWKVERTDRVNTAARVVAHVGSTIVFCRTKRGADRLARQLTTAGVPSAAIHGDRSQSQRERALKDFRSGRARALVATDVAARGIHVDSVAGVVHYDPPADHKDYVHRSGRTARAGSDGVVVSLVIPDLKQAVGQLQRELGLPKGLSTVDLEALGAPTPVVTAPPAARESQPRQEANRRGDPPRRRSTRNAGRRNGSAPAASSDRRSSPERSTDGQRSTRQSPESKPGGAGRPPRGRNSSTRNRNGKGGAAKAGSGRSR